MSTIVYQGTMQPSSCYESQLITHEPRSLTLKLSSPSTSSKLNFSQCFDQQTPHKLPSSSSSSNNPAMFDYNWGCIQSLPTAALHREHDQKSETNKNDVYIHPMIKKSSSLLDKKSLEMCTENLGSETGSETAPATNSHCSSTPPPPPDHLDSHSSIPLFHHRILTDVLASNHDDEAEIHGADYSMKSPITSSSPSSARRNSTKSSVVVKNNYKREFPPPLTTISGPNSVHVKRHCMDGGRLVIETVAAPPKHSCMQAERSDGRLRLTLTTTRPVNNNNYYSCDLDDPAAEEDDLISSWFNQRPQSDDEDVFVGDLEEEVGDEELEIEDRTIHVVSADHRRQEINSCGDVGAKNGINEDSFQRPSRCKEGDTGAGGRGRNKTLNTWEAFWVATS